MSDAGRDEARAAAIRLLARREHTRQELEDKLGRRGYPRGVVADVIEELLEEGLLDEGRFAEAFVNSRVERGQGPVRIEYEMRQRGVPAHLAREALQALAVDWREQARAVRRHRFGDRVPADRREAARQAQFLQRRGFTAEQVRAAATPADEDG